MLSVKAGYNWRYLTRQVGTGRENYYLSAVALGGEPPGRWVGRGVEALGLSGEVSARDMEALYGHFTVPVTGEVLGRPPRQFVSLDERLAAAKAVEPGAGPERLAAIELGVRKSQRAAVHFLDVTFSPAKSVSVLWASAARQAADAGAAARAAEVAGDVTEGERLRGVEASWRGVADQVWEGVKVGNAAMLEYLQDAAGYSRAGYHGRTADGGSSGRWVDAHEWMVSSFEHHISREGDPQLHIHNAVLNRVACADGAWRTLDGRAVYRERAAGGAIGERVMEEYLTRHLGVEFVMRADGRGREIVGIEEGVREAFSTRRAAIRREVATLAEAYEARHGRAPSAHVLSKISQLVTLEHRPVKSRSVPSRLEQLAAWEAKCEVAAGQLLGQVADRALGRVDLGAQAAADGAAVAVLDRDPAVREPGVGGPVAGDAPGVGERLFDPGEVIAAAVQQAATAKSVWTRSDLIRALNAQLPDCLGGLGARQIQDLLEDLAEVATTAGAAGGVVRLDPPALVPTPGVLCLANGASAYEPAGGARYAAAAALAREEALLAAAARPGAPAAAPRAVEAGLAELARAGHTLATDQAAAVRGIATSGRAVEVLIGPAGTGKSHTLGALRQIWETECGPVLGLALAQNAVDVLAGEGLTNTRNIRQFFRAVDAGDLELRPGQLVVVDEAGMAPTEDLARVEEYTRAAGAKLLLVGDDRQLDAVGAGGALRLLVQEAAGRDATGAPDPADTTAVGAAAGVYELGTVHRFRADWEREASLRLRAGDSDVLAVYDRHGRLVEGNRDDMAAAARRGWLADHLAGRPALLTVSSNETAAVLSAAVREDLVALGRVEPAGVALGHKDAAGTLAGVGDLIATRRNDRTLTEPHSLTGDGRRHFVTNRDVWQVSDRHGDGALIVRRRLDAGGWGPPVRLPAHYVADSVTLAYAATVHAAQGRTVDSAHCLVDANTGPAALYVGMTRGREVNVAYCVTAETEATAPDAPADGAMVDRAEAAQLDRFGLLAGILEQADPERSATEVLRTELERIDALDRLHPIWADVTGAHHAAQHAAAVRGALAAVLGSDADGQRQAAAVLEDPAAGTLTRLLAAAAEAGHDTDALLTRAVSAARGFGDAESIAKVLHYRLERLTTTDGGLAPRTGRTFTDRTPDATAWPGEVGEFARELAAVMDTRVATLAAAAAADPPAWARERLGPVPADPAQAGEWLRRAGAVAAYREAHGHTYGAGLRERDPIGGMPPRGAVAARTAWYDAHAALHAGATGVVEGDVTALDVEALRARIRAHARAEATAPPYVADELRQASLDARDAAERATLARASGDLQAAERWQRLAAELEEHRRELAAADEARAAWHTQSTPTREAAEAAWAELAARGLTGEAAGVELDEPGLRDLREDDIPRPEPLAEASHTPLTPGSDTPHTQVQAAPAADPAREADPTPVEVEPVQAAVEAEPVAAEPAVTVSAAQRARLTELNWQIVRADDDAEGAAARAAHTAFLAELGPERVELLDAEHRAWLDRATAEHRARQAEQARDMQAADDRPGWAARAFGTYTDAQLAAAATAAEAERAKALAAAEHTRTLLAEREAAIAAGRGPKLLEVQARHEALRAAEDVAAHAHQLEEQARAVRQQQADAHVEAYRRRAAAENAPFYRPGLRDRLSGEAAAYTAAAEQARVQAEEIARQHTETRRRWAELHRDAGGRDRDGRDLAAELNTARRADAVEVERLRYRADEHTAAAQAAAARRVDLDTETELRAGMPGEQVQAETVLRTGWQREQAAAAAARRQQELELEQERSWSYDYTRDLDRGIDLGGPSIGM